MRKKIENGVKSKVLQHYSIYGFAGHNCQKCLTLDDDETVEDLKNYIFQYLGQCCGVLVPTSALFPSTRVIVNEAFEGDD